MGFKLLNSRVFEILVGFPIIGFFTNFWHQVATSRWTSLSDGEVQAIKIGVITLIVQVLVTLLKEWIKKRLGRRSSSAGESLFFKLGVYMKQAFKNGWEHPKTTIAGVISGVAFYMVPLMAGWVQDPDGFSWSRFGIALLIAVATWAAKDYKKA